MGFVSRWCDITGVILISASNASDRRPLNLVVGFELLQWRREDAQEFLATFQ